MLKRLLLKMIDGFIYGFGFVFFSSVIILLIGFGSGQLSLYQIKAKLQKEQIIFTSEKVQPNGVRTTVLKDFKEARIAIPPDYKKVLVSNEQELSASLRDASQSGGKVAIILSSGTYEFKKPIYIKTDNIMLMSESGSPYDVNIKGQSMFAGGNLFRVSANHFYVDGITLSDARNHLIQIAGESNASYLFINNCILQDGHQQFIKASYSKSTPEHKSVGGIVQNSIFQYTHGIAPHYYTGGIDAIGAVDWVVKNNVFKDIASPHEFISQHAVHFWVNSAGNKVINNLFIDVDRAIGFGMPLPHNASVEQYSHKDGEITGNVIYHSKNGDPFGDVGIILESAEGAIAKNNTVYMEHDYPRAIEYRWANSLNIKLENNAVNKKISSRDGATANLLNNRLNLSKTEFILHYNDILEELSIIDVNSPLEENQKEYSSNE